MLKIALALVKTYVLVGKKGISGWVSKVAAKTTAPKVAKKNHIFMHLTL